MNIFYLHNDPKIAAQMHCNKHVVKMILESCQMLSTAHHLCGDPNSFLLAETHSLHPPTIWARTNKENYIWLSKLTIELCKEYTHRYGKIHKLQPNAEWFLDNIPKNIPDGSFTEPTLAMRDEYKEMFKDYLHDHIKSYKLYYIFDKWRMLNYKNRNEPQWVTDAKNYFLSSAVTVK